MAAKGELVPADPDESAALYELTRDLSAAAGLPAYEISNHARPGEESRHNLAYWRYQAYAGIGPGAHGRRSGLRTVRHKKPENFLAAVARNGHGLVGGAHDHLGARLDRDAGAVDELSRLVPRHGRQLAPRPPGRASAY